MPHGIEPDSGSLPRFEAEELPDEVMLFEALPVFFDVARLRRAMCLRPGSKEESIFDTMVRNARTQGRPKAIYRQAHITEHGHDGVCIDGVRFDSPLLQRQLASHQRVFPYIITCGRELAALEPATRTTLERYYWGEICNAILRGAHRLMQTHLEQRFLIPKTSYLSPGSGAAWLWPIEQQGLLFSLLGAVTKRIGVSLTEDNMIMPPRSISGLHYPSEKTFRTCRACRIENCPNRLAPFDPELWKDLKQEED